MEIDMSSYFFKLTVISRLGQFTTDNVTISQKYLKSVLYTNCITQYLQFYIHIKITFN